MYDLTYLGNSLNKCNKCGAIVESGFMNIYNHSLNCGKSMNENDKPYKVYSVRNLVWRKTAGGPQSDYEKQRLDQEYYNMRRYLVGENQGDLDCFAAERAFYHLNPEE